MRRSLPEHMHVPAHAGGGTTIERIGVISDTHGMLRPEAVTALAGSEVILHAGDVGEVGILDRLREMAPVHAVRGNMDGGELRRSLPASAVVELGGRDRGVGSEGLLAYLFHGDRELDLDPVAAGIALVVSGHTHRPRVGRRDGVLYLNPGSAGPRRLRLPVTVARVTVAADGSLSAEIVPLEVR